MRIKDYRHADCTLFRIPPIDTSGVDGAIGIALANAWKNKGDLNSTINKILSDKSIFGQLEKQISENLDFQRASAMGTIEARTKRRIQLYEDRRKNAFGKIELKYDTDGKESEMSSLGNQIDKQRKAYSAAEERLNNIRRIARGRFERLGGEKGYLALMEINDSLTAAKGTQTKKRKSREYNLDLLKDKEYTLPGEEHGRSYKFFKKVWGVLNYKLF
jgi:hypothetical protein